MSVTFADRRLAEAIDQHARWSAPNESCGLLALDADGVVRFVYALTNADAAPDRFTISPAEFFGAARHAEAHSWHVGGMFHSHPGGRATPSQTDVEQAPSPDWAYVVHTVGGMKAYAIRNGRVTRVPIRFAADWSPLPADQRCDPSTP